MKRSFNTYLETTTDLQHQIDAAALITALEKSHIHDAAIVNHHTINTSKLHYVNCASGKNIPPLRLGQESADRTNILVKYGNEKNIYAKACGQHIDIFNIVSGKIKKTLKLHTSTVQHCVNAVDNQVIISSGHETISIWNTLCNKPWYSVHTGKLVTNLAAKNATFCSTDLLNTIKIWDLENGTCARTINLKNRYEGDFNSLMMENNLIHAGLNNGTIISIDPKSGKVIYAWQAHEARITSIAPCKNNAASLYSGSGDHTIKLWDTRNLTDSIAEMKHDEKSHKYHNITNILEDKERRTIFSSDQYSVYEWDVSQVIPTLLTSLCLDSTIRHNCMVIEDNEKETSIGMELHLGTDDGIKTIRCDYSFDEMCEEIAMQFMEKK